LKFKKLMIRIPLFLILSLSLMHFTSSAQTPRCEDQLTSVTLESLVEKARILVSQNKKDPDLSAQIKALANLKMGGDLSKMGPSEVEAFKLATQLGEAEKKWTFAKHLRENPIHIVVPVESQTGFSVVDAYITFTDLILNGSVMERVAGITFVMKIDPSDERVNTLKSETLSPIHGNDFGNTKARARRRFEVINFHQTKFAAYKAKPNYRMIHTAFSLSRIGKSKYLFPLSESDTTSNSLIRGTATETETFFMAQELASVFKGLLRGRRDIRLLQGFRSGGAKRFSR